MNNLKIKEYAQKILDKYRVSVIYNFGNGIAAEIISNSDEGLMTEYFSKKAVIPSLDANIKIIVCVENPDEIETEIKEICKNQSLRSKRIAAGYYNLNHFGDSAYYYKDEDVYYLFGTKKSCKKIFWSYIMKWLLTEKVPDEFVHLKATAITVNGQGVLIIGGKSSGKSSFVYNLTKKSDVKFVTNTHIIIDRDLNAYGVFSNINYRKDMALKICSESSQLNNMEITGCTNLDPEKIGYALLDKAKIDTVIFYQFNKEAKCDIIELNSDEMFLLMDKHANALNAYSLSDDMLSYYGINTMIRKLIHISQNQRHICENTKKYAVLCDSESDLCLEKVIKEVLC